MMVKLINAFTECMNYPITAKHHMNLVGVPIELDTRWKNKKECTEYKKMVIRQFYDIMESNGVKEIEAEGAEFDPNFHNAVMHIEDDSYGENVVVEVLQKGYIIGERVIRHAMVKVAN